MTGLVRSASFSGLDRVGDIRLSRSFSGLRSRLDHLLTAGFLGRLFLECLPERAPDEELYNLLGGLYDGLAQGVAVRTVALFGQDRLLSAMGFEIGLFDCVVCEACDLCGFSAAHGGLLCSKCVRETGSLLLSSAALKVLREVRELQLPHEQLVLLPEVTREVGRVYKMQLQEHLGVSGRLFRPVLPARSIAKVITEEETL